MPPQQHQQQELLVLADACSLRAGEGREEEFEWESEDQDYHPVSCRTGQEERRRLPTMSGTLQHKSGKLVNHDGTTTDPLHQSTSFWHEIRYQISTALPTLFNMTLNKIPWMISLRFVSQSGEGSEALAAAALATTIFNVTGLSLSVGLSSALVTLTGQARGDLKKRKMQQEQKRDKNHNIEREQDPVRKRDSVKTRQQFVEDVESSIEQIGLLRGHKMISMETCEGDDLEDDSDTLVLLPMVYLYRGLFVQFLLVLPIGLWWIMMGTQQHQPTLLLRLGQHATWAQMTVQYLSILAPGLWAYSMHWTITAWLQTLEMAAVPAYAAAIGLVTHVPLNYLFCSYSQSFLGCAMATVAYQFLQPILVLLYLFVFGGSNVVLRRMHAATKRRRLLVWHEVRQAVTSMTGLFQYCGLALPGIVLISEWWASEILIFLSGHLQPSPDLALSGMSLYQTINAFCFMFPMAFAIAGSARVGNWLGTGNARQAEFAGRVTVVCAGTVSALLGCVLYVAPHAWIPSLFAPSEDTVIAEAASTIPLLAIYVFADGVQAALNGIIKGCGKQVITMPIVLVAYWICAVPLGYYLAFVRKGGIMCDDSFFCGIRALVTGATAGTIIHMILLSVVVFGFTDWQKEVYKARDRVGAASTSSCRNREEVVIEMQAV